ncbi:hypothetical protein TNCV_2355201 [Trichonephila clavipes]|nr:hypothetical protein TNCV_2355201 [Trichonephila clavipes]
MCSLNQLVRKSCRRSQQKPLVQSAGEYFPPHPFPYLNWGEPYGSDAVLLENEPDWSAINNNAIGNRISSANRFVEPFELYMLS